MHAIVVALGSHGDVHPFIGLAQVLRGRGHRVSFAVNPHFEPLVRRAGFDDVAPLGTAEQFTQGLHNPDIWHPTKGWKRVFELGVFPFLRPTYDLVVERNVPGESVVVSHVLGIGARVACERHDIPIASVQLSPAVFRSVHESPTLPGLFMPPWMPRWMKQTIWNGGDRYVLDPFVGPPVNALRREVGLSAPRAGIVRDYWFSPDLIVATFPAWFAPPQPDWPRQVRLTGFPLYDVVDVSPLGEELESFLAEGGDRADAKPIVFTPGTANIHGGPFFAAAADACRRLGRRGILLSRHREHVPRSLPAGVRHFDYAPFSRLLPRCATTVHHGGIGTTAQTLAAGIPHLVWPLSHDQLDNAARVRRLGCGSAVFPRKFTGPRVADALARLVDVPAVAAACAAVAQRFKGIRPPLEESADHIEALVEERLRSGREPERVVAR